MFSRFAKWFSNMAGNSLAFIFAILIVFVWGITGPIFQYSDTWELVINTFTTIITFLMVFLIQNTQNRDMLAVQLKLDEIIRSLKGAHNQLVDIENLTDEELECLHQRYVEFAKQVQRKVKQGGKDIDAPK